MSNLTLDEKTNNVSSLSIVDRWVTQLENKYKGCEQALTTEEQVYPLMINPSTSKYKVYHLFY